LNRPEADMGTYGSEVLKRTRQDVATEQVGTSDVTARIDAARIPLLIDLASPARPDGWPPSARASPSPAVSSSHPSRSKTARTCSQGASPWCLGRYATPIRLGVHTPKRTQCTRQAARPEAPSAPTVRSKAPSITSHLISSVRAMGSKKVMVTGTSDAPQGNKPRLRNTRFCPYRYLQPRYVI
jgi:hypothetical protein